MLEILNQNGSITSLKIFYSSLCYNKDIVERWNDFFKEIKIDRDKITIHKIDMEHFNLSVGINGQYSTYKKGEQPAELRENPNFSRLLSVIRYNNCFLEKNSQSIIPDFQFDGEDYINNIKPLHSIDNVLEQINNQQPHYHTNMAILIEAIEYEWIEAPDWFLHFVNTPNYLNFKSYTEVYKKHKT